MLSFIHISVYIHYQTHIKFSLLQPFCACFSAAVECPDGYVRNPISNTCLKLYKTNKNWNAARDHCEGMGQTLATFETLESANWFVHLRKTNSGNLPKAHLASFQQHQQDQRCNINFRKNLGKKLLIQKFLSIELSELVIFCKWVYIH